jgi:protein involved in polysaccharide export with SLBB domain
MLRIAKSAAAHALVLLLVACAAPLPDGGDAGGATAASGAVGASATAGDKARAERSIYTSLTQGVARYQITPGDTLLLTFTEDLRPSQTSYAIRVRDKLRVEFFYHQEASRTVTVRPDGRVTLPMRGDVDAAGMTPDQFAARVREMYKGVFRDPVVTVSVEEFNSPFNDLVESVKTAQYGRSKQIVVAPDGTVSLPMLAPVKTGGRTIEELQTEINRLYGERIAGVDVSVSLEKLAGERIFVFGEVRGPGMITMTRPMTALQLITAAGGALGTGAMNSVRILSWTPTGEPAVRTVDLEAMLNGEKLDQDVIVAANSVVYVPPTDIAKLDRFVDQYIRQLFLFNGSSIGATYLFTRNQNGGGVIVVPQ